MIEGLVMMSVLKIKSAYEKYTYLPNKDPLIFFMCKTFIEIRF